MNKMIKFRDDQEQRCSTFVRHALAARGVGLEMIDSLAVQILGASAVPDLDNDDDSFGPDMMNWMRLRRCWVIREEDLDIVGTLAKFVPPVAGAAAAITLVAGAAAATPVAAGIAASLAFMVNVYLNAKRKGVTLDPIAIRALAVLKERPDGSSVEVVKNALDIAIGDEFSTAAVGDLLASLSTAQMDASGTTVAVAFKRNDLWFSAV